jgi:Protein of unknown function (DUF2628)
MPTYTVHQPPAKNGRAADSQRFVFVRDGFHFWAFLLTLPWLIYRRQWLVLIGYLLLTAVMSVVFYFLRTSGWAQAAVGLLIGLLFGLEAASIRRWTYRRRGWANIGVVVGDDQEDAERRFFADWVTREPQQEIVRDKAPPPLVQRTAPAATDIVGLFPQPERRA